MNINELKQISLQKAEGFENIYFLNGFSSNKNNKERILYRYRPFLSALKDFSANKLGFVSPVLWKDKFERRFLFTDYSKYNFSGKTVRCMCFASDNAMNEEASWKSYNFEEKDTVIRMSIKSSELLFALDNFAKKQKSKVFVGEAIYGASVDEIENIHKQCKKYNQIFFSDSFNIEHYLFLMLLKRKAFIYENEIRVFILHDNNTSTRETEYSDKEKKSTTKLIDFVPVDFSQIIKEIRISPYCSNSEIVKSVLDGSYKIQKFKNVTISRLYENGSELDKV